VPGAEAGSVPAAEAEALSGAEAHALPPAEAVPRWRQGLVELTEVR
jgi:hypothetical protein